MLKTDRFLLQALIFGSVSIPLTYLFVGINVFILERISNEPYISIALCFALPMILLVWMAMVVALPEFIVRRIERRVTGNVKEKKKQQL